MISQAQKQALVWGGLLILFGVLGLVTTFVELSAWIWGAILAVAGLGVFAVYLTDRSDWSLLIPVYVLWVVALFLVLITLNVLRDEFIATYVLAAIALPFLVVYLRDRAQWWALIPAYVLTAVGVMVALIERGVLNDLLVPAYVMFAIAIPFIAVYARDRRQWWSLIPGGIMTLIGLGFLIAEAAVQYVAPVVLVLAGIWILLRQFMHKEPAAPNAPAPAGAEAGEPPAE
ncbi:MAG: hypothetical protein P8186_02385 [Anaerolineae bacterium]|jgi:hypothetical protein